MSEQRISNRARVLAIPAAGAAVLGISIFTRGGFAQDSTATPSASPAASPAASPEAGLATSLDLTAGDIYFDPKQLTAAANTDVQVTITNVGAAAHDFVIDALNIKTPLINPGSSETVTINAPAGDYEYYCSVPGHKAAGMVGTLTLQDAPAAGADSGEGQSAAAAAADVVAGDIYFDPKQLTLAANTDVQVTVTNIGAAAHDFVIDELGIKTAMLNPGGSETVTINAPAGDYEYYCNVPGHKAAGMRGTLTLQ